MPEVDQYLWLRPDVNVHRDGATIALMDASGEVVQIEDEGETALELIAALDRSARGSTLATHDAVALVDLLSGKGWIVTLTGPLDRLLADPSASSRELGAYAQLFPHDLDHHFRILRQKRALVVGTGGIGSGVTFALSAAGVGAVTIVDPDVIDGSNLNRQFLFATSDVGQAKVAVVAREVARRFPRTEVRAVQSDFDDAALAKELVANADLVILCGESDILLDDPELLGDKPLLTTGYRGRTGTVGPLTRRGSGTACWSCLMNTHGRRAMRIVERHLVPRTSGWNPSGYSINAICGGICSRIAVEILSEQLSADRWLGMQISISLDDFSTRIVPVEPLSCEHSTGPDERD